MLVGLDTPSAGKPHARERRVGTAGYVDIAVVPTDVIAHGDNRFISTGAGGPYIDTLGGKHDPGISFDWARFQNGGIGLQRQAPPVSWAGAQPEGIERGSFRPNQAWLALESDDEAEYDRLPDYRDASGLLDPNSAAVRQIVWGHLNEIGYWVGTSFADGGTMRNFATQVPSGNHVNVRPEFAPLPEAIRSFKTHFFTSALRHTAKREEDSTLDKATVIWIRKVAEYLRSQNRP